MSWDRIFKKKNNIYIYIFEGITGETPVEIPEDCFQKTLAEFLAKFQRKSPGRISDDMLGRALPEIFKEIREKIHIQTAVESQEELLIETPEEDQRQLLKQLLKEFLYESLEKHTQKKHYQKYIQENSNTSLKLHHSIIYAAYIDPSFNFILILNTQVCGG